MTTRSATWPWFLALALLLVVLPMRGGIGVLLHLRESPSYWQLSRAAGLLSYLILWLAVVSGAVSRLPISPKARPVLMELHNWGAAWGAYTALFHASVLLWDRYVTFSWTDLALPFTASYKPVLVGLGTLGFYGLLLVILTTHLRQFLRPGLWRWLHAFSYPAYAIALWHGLALGTDSHLLWVTALYSLTAGLLFLLIVGRLTYTKGRNI